MLSKSQKKKPVLLAFADVLSLFWVCTGVALQHSLES
jgi:hypothetical protein